MKIEAVKHLRGKIKLPGDKSISHRAGMISAIAEGETIIENFATSVDCSSTLSCLKQLGVLVERHENTVKIKGVGKKGLRFSPSPLDCGNSGTTVRLLSGILAGQDFVSTLIGDESLSQRPMKRIIEPLSLMGARLEADKNTLPLKVFGKNPLQAIEYTPEKASAQIKSCVLLAALNASGETIFLEKTPTRDHTEKMFRWFGVEVEATSTADGTQLKVDGSAKLTAKNLTVPADISSAAFFLVAGACLNGSEIVLENVGLNPTRRAIIDVLLKFGAKVEIFNEREQANEPVGDLRVIGKGKLQTAENANVLRGKIIANLIDEIPILAIFGTQLENGLEIREAEELRVKESDRIAAVVKNLRLMQADVEEFPDGFKVKKSKLKGAKIDSFGDHRIAMAFAIAGLLAEGETFIDNAECAGVSFPEFFKTLEILQSAVSSQQSSKEI